MRYYSIDKNMGVWNIELGDFEEYFKIYNTVQIFKIIIFVDLQNEESIEYAKAKFYSLQFEEMLVKCNFSIFFLNCEDQENIQLKSDLEIF